MCIIYPTVIFLTQGVCGVCVCVLACVWACVCVKLTERGRMISVYPPYFICGTLTTQTHMLMVFKIVSLWEVISIGWGHVGWGSLGDLSGFKRWGENPWVDTSFCFTITRCHVRMQQENPTRHQSDAFLRLSSFLNRSVVVRQSNRKVD